MKQQQIEKQNVLSGEVKTLLQKIENVNNCIIELEKKLKLMDNLSQDKQIEIYEKIELAKRKMQDCCWEAHEHVNGLQFE